MRNDKFLGSKFTLKELKEDYKPIGKSNIKKRGGKFFENLTSLIDKTTGLVDEIKKPIEVDTNVTASIDNKTMMLMVGGVMTAVVLFIFSAFNKKSKK